MDALFRNCVGTVFCVDDFVRGAQRELRDGSLFAAVRVGLFVHGSDVAEPVMVCAPAFWRERAGDATCINRSAWLLGFADRRAVNTGNRAFGRENLLF